MWVLVEEKAELPERGEDIEQRKPEDRRMVALDRLKELDAKRFKLVSSDSLEHAPAHRGKISVEEGIRDFAHRKPR